MLKNARNKTKNIINLGLLLLLALFPLIIRDSYLLHIMIMAGIKTILATSLWLIIKTGMLSFGHGAFMGIGAYTSALLSLKLELPFWLTLPTAGIAASVAAKVKGTVFHSAKLLFYRSC